MQAVGRIRERLIERLEKREEENEDLRLRLTKLEEKHEQSERQIFQYSVTDERTLGKMVTLEDSVRPLKSDLQMVKTAATEDRGAIHRIEQMLSQMSGGGFSFPPPQPINPQGHHRGLQ